MFPFTCCLKHEAVSWAASALTASQTIYHHGSLAALNIACISQGNCVSIARNTMTMTATQATTSTLASYIVRNGPYDNLHYLFETTLLP